MVKFSGAPVTLSCYARDPVEWENTIDRTTENDLRIENQLCSINQSTYHCSTLGFLATTNDTVLARCFANSGAVRYAISAYRIEVQGLLAAPRDFGVTNEATDCETCVPLSWTPPPTLDVTDVEPDISMYTLYIKNMNSGMMEMRNVTVPEYTFSALPDEVHADGRIISYEISVSAWNEVGEGETCGSIDVHLPRSNPNSAAAASFVNNISTVVCAMVAILLQYIYA